MTNEPRTTAISHSATTAVLASLILRSFGLAAGVGAAILLLAALLGG
jgi:hypothetical protein